MQVLEHDGQAAETSTPRSERPAAPHQAFAEPLAGRIGALDTATRARVVTSLQRGHGNASVQRLASGLRRGDRAPLLQRAISYDACSSSEETVISDSHSRAMDLVSNALTKLNAYDGTKPADVRTALQSHLKSTSTVVAWGVGNHLRAARDGARDATYECNPHGTSRGWSAWCVPFTDIDSIRLGSPTPTSMPGPGR